MKYYSNTRYYELLVLLFLFLLAPWTILGSNSSVGFDTLTVGGEISPSWQNSQTRLNSDELISNQQTPAFNLSDYSGLENAELTFAGRVDYDEDGTQDLLFVVRYPEESRDFDMIILDGSNYNLLEKYTDIVPSIFSSQFETHYVVSAGSIPNILIRFEEVGANLCNWVFIDISSPASSNLVEDCLDYQEYIDWDSDGEFELLRFASNGDFWSYSSDLDFTSEEIGNLFSGTGIGTVSHLGIGNFSNDGFPDIFTGQFDVSTNTTLVYLVDSVNQLVISNISINLEINSIYPLNINNEGTDELIYVTSNTGQPIAINTTGHIQPYNTLQTGYDFEVSEIVPDLDNDDVDDLVLVDEENLLVVISGMDGSIRAVTSHLGNAQNSLSVSTRLIFGEFTSSQFILQHTESELHLSTMTSVMINPILSIPWSPVLTKNDFDFDTNSYTLEMYDLGFNIDEDQDDLTLFDEFILGTDDTTSDTDGDGLGDRIETALGLNPTSIDSDGDGIDDAYEFSNEMNYHIDDADLDFDQDGLTNLEEYLLGTEIYISDTDGDSLPDGWEVEFGYDPTAAMERFYDTDGDGLSSEEEYMMDTNPLNSDSDGDGLPDGWEVDYEFNPLIRDSQTDSDGDGLTELEEYRYGLDPHSWDTDGDGLSDGYEVENNLDPLVDDANQDADNDFLPNYIEEKLGTNPNGRYDRIINISLVMLILIGLGYLVVKYRQLSKLASNRGFQNYLHMRQINKLGFDSPKAYEKARFAGFNSKEGQTLVNSYGFDTTEAMMNSWEKFVYSLDKYLGMKIIKEEIVNLQNVKTLSQFKANRLEIKDDIDNLKLQLQKLNRVILEQDTILELIERSKHQGFVDLDRNIIVKYKSKLLKQRNSFEGVLRSYSKTIEKMETWFKPWSGLLSLIQMSGEGSITPLSEIAQVLDIPNDHARLLIKGVISENKFIGSFSDEKDEFMRGIKINDYVKFVLDNIDPEEDET